MGGGLGGHKFKHLDNLPNGWTELAPNLVHACGFIWEWTSRLNTISIAPLLGGFRGQQLKSLDNLPNGWTDWHNIKFWFTSADSSRNGHRLTN